MAKIVVCDNYDRGKHDEQFLNIHHITDEDAKKIVDILTNDKYYPEGVYQPMFYRVVPNGYSLHLTERWT